ncbi:MAG: hypothetical protein ACOY4T_04485 [Pseudomonadota bacterium]|jgi:hypothetical protein
MLGPLVSGVASAGSRLAFWAITLAIWLISRPGGWAVLVVLILFALRWFPETPPLPAQ